MFIFGRRNVIRGQGSGLGRGASPIQTDIDPRILRYSQGTFSRASEASYFYEDSGTLQWWPSGSLRETTLTAPNGLKYFVFEGARTNRVTYSRDIGGTGWTKPGFRTSNATASADGVTEAERLSVGAGSTGAFINFGVQANGITSAVSCLFKQSTGSLAGLTGSLFFGTGLSSGSSGMVDSPVNSTWKRLSCKHVSGGSAEDYLIVLDSQNRTAIGGYAAQARDAFVDLVQVESGSFPSTVIRTSGAVATRVADNLTFPSNVLPGDYSIYVKPFFNSDQLKTDGITYNLFGRASDGSGANAGLVFRGAAGLARVAIFAPNGGIQSNIDVTCTFSAHQQLKITVKASTGQIVLEGFTTGNGTWGNGTPWTWPNATLYVARFASGFTRNFFGLMTEPFIP